MSVSREVSIEFDGTVYWLTPSNKLLRRIDAGLAPQSIYGFLGQASTSPESVSFPALAYIIAELIREGGGDVDEDDVMAEMHHDMAENEGKGIGPLVESVGAAISPQKRESAGKNQQAPAGNRGKTKKAK